MALDYLFSVCAHGVKKVIGKNEGIYAVFKVIAGSTAFNDPQNTIPVTTTDWQAFVNTVNSLSFKGSFEGNVLKIQILNQEATGRGSDKDELQFQDPDISDDDLKKKNENGQVNNGLKSFSIGIRNPFQSSEKQINTMNFVENTKEGFCIFDEKGKKSEIFQLLRPPGLIAMESYDYFTKNFKEAGAFRKEKHSSEDDGRYDFKSLYGTIINDPYVAERHFGLIREVRILITDILKEGQDELEYTIVISDKFFKKEDPTKYVLQRINIGGKLKYYNGLKKMFFIDSDFDSKEFSNFDLYKDLDNSSPEATKHPDGIYLNVRYFENADNTIVDPFVIPGIKGYNIAIKSKEFYSLSYHERTFRFKKYDKLVYRTSGLLNPRVETITSNTTSIRNNILFIWRGDNLMAHRLEDNKQGKKGAFVRTIMKFDRQNRDYKFMHDELFVKEHRLIKGTQPQLTANEEYYFVLRTVGYTEYCLPMNKELSNDEKNYMLTLEDIASKGLAGIIITNAPYKFAINDIKLLPIRSPLIRGQKFYNDPNSKAVDTANHLVLNQVRNINQEKRFIFPPAIKLEDFKFLGYMSQENLTEPASPPVTERQFVNRCIHLENRSRNKIHDTVSSVKKVPYLADLRVSGLMLLPMDFFTYRRFKLYVTPSNIFKYSSNYPYYDNVYSAELKIKKDLGTSTSQNPQYDVLLNDSPVYGQVELGLYRFKLCAIDNQSHPFKLFSKEQLDISVVGLPTMPNSDDKKPNILRVKENKNYWYSILKVSESDSWKSIKYTEEFEILNLTQEGHPQMFKQFKENGGNSPQLMDNEYPYEMFIIKKGDINSTSEYKTFIYPNNISIRVRANKSELPANRQNDIQNGQPLFSLKLNDKDVITGYTESGFKQGVRLFLNERSIFETDLNTVANYFDLSIQFDPKMNRFNLVYVNNPASALEPIPNLINPDMTAYDLTVAEELLYFIQEFPSSYYIQFQRPGDYVFIENLQNPYYIKKTVKLFASSVFQGYFPDQTYEHTIGTTGSQHVMIVPNNIEPEIPVMEANVLFMYTRDDCWHDRFSKSEKSSTVRNLVQLTLSEDFMKEGKNRLGLIISRIDGSSDDVSAVGEDITKLTSALETSLYDLIDFDIPLEVLSKYCNANKFQAIVNNINCELVQFDPYYNSSLKKWQVILPLKSFGVSETIFFKFSALKIALGYDNETSFSKIAKPVILPVYNTRTFRVLRDHGSYTILYEGPKSYKQKLFFVMLKKHHHDFSILENGEIFPALADIEVPDSTPLPSPFHNRKVLQFSSEKIAIKKVHSKCMLLLEFDVLDNYKGDSGIQLAYQDFNPMFDKPGLHLVSVAEFETDWL